MRMVTDAPELLYPFPTAALALPVSDLRSASTRQVGVKSIIFSMKLIVLGPFWIEFG